MKIKRTIKIMEVAMLTNKLIKYWIIMNAILFRIKIFVFNHAMHNEISFKNLKKYLFHNYDYKYYYGKK